MSVQYKTRPFEVGGTRDGRSLITGGMVLSLCALLLLVAAGPGTRFGLWHFRTGFAIIRVAAYGGIAAGVVDLVALFSAINIKGRRALGVAVALVALMFAVTAVVVPFSWKRAAEQVPPIHDISTDLDAPPRFIAILPLRLGAANPVEYGGPEVAAQQRQAYPDLKTLVLDIPATEAFAKALAAARRLHWSIVAEAPDEGRIEATDTTFWFGFKDDIVIRITQAEKHARVDVRSLSRVGGSDVGTNARRIRTFLNMLTS